MTEFFPPSRYHLSGQLGHGGFSTVYKAWDELRSEEVAIKVFLKSDDEGVALCRDEYDRTIALRHPNIIQFYDFGVSLGAPFIVMPYYERGAVQNCLGELVEEDMWKLIYDIGNTLDYIHQLNPPVLHNDIKPDNFLISHNDEFILTDFGISTALNMKMMRSRDSFQAEMDDNKEPRGRGPMAYRAPELFHYRDQQRQSPIKATDIWAFGASLYEIATGETPFGDQGGLYQLMEIKDNHSRLYDILEPLPSQFSGVLNNLIFDCLALSPWERPKASEICEEARMQLHADTAVVQVPPNSTFSQPTVGRPSPHYPPPYMPPVPNTPSQNKTVIWAVAASLTALLGGIGGSYLYFRSVPIVPPEIVAEPDTQKKPDSLKYIDRKQDQSTTDASNSDNTPPPPKDENTLPDESNITDDAKTVDYTDISNEKQPSEVKASTGKKFDKYHSNHPEYHYVYTFTSESEARALCDEFRELYQGYPVDCLQRSNFEWAVYFGNFKSRSERKRFLEKFPEFHESVFAHGSGYLKD